MAPGSPLLTRSAKPLQIGLLWLLPLVIKATAGEITLDLPLQCRLGSTCFIQNYVDHDSSTGLRDYQCGRRTYDGHDGTDFRLLDLNAQRDGVAVTAAADGKVAAMRDGVEDISIRTTGRAAVAGRECGNGAVIEHGEGWQTQYCHLAKHSLRVKTGDRLHRGDILGLVGLSGATEFPHLHFTVRYMGLTVDPFAFNAAANACGGGRSLWTGSLREQTAYRSREILNIGLSRDAPTLDMIELGEMDSHAATTEAEAIIAYVRVIGLQEGDQETLSIHNSDGSVIAEHQSQPLERDKAQHLLFTGKKRKQALWAAGQYKIAYAVMRDGQRLLEKSVEVELKMPKR